MKKHIIEESYCTACGKKLTFRRQKINEVKFDSKTGKRLETIERLYKCPNSPRILLSKLDHIELTYYYCNGKFLRTFEWGTGSWRGNY